VFLSQIRDSYYEFKITEPVYHPELNPTEPVVLLILY
jgi:hypothetical protein